jgi:hypothetical protein
MLFQLNSRAWTALIKEEANYQQSFFVNLSTQTTASMEAVDCWSSREREKCDTCPILFRILKSFQPVAKYRQDSYALPAGIMVL